MAAGQGICAGCGMKGPVRKVSAHIVDCPEFAALHAKDPKLALDPATAFQEWEKTGRAQERSARIAQTVQAVNQQRAEQQRRFVSLPDCLADE